MTHPVYAAIARERARYDAPPADLAERIVADLRTASAAEDARAREVVLRLEHLVCEAGGDVTPASAYLAGVIVAEYLGVAGDYAIRRWATAYGRALLTARALLADRAPDPQGNGWAWAPETEAHVAGAVARSTPTPTVITIDPTRRSRRG